MKITVEVTNEELDEMDLTAEQLHVQVIMDLDRETDYVGYNVEVIVND
jgi:hypothetical protein